MGWNTDGYTADDFSTIIDKYYTAFTDEYGFVSESRFRGSREYEVFYSSAQVDMQYQAVLSETFNKVTIWMQDVNFKINAPSTVNSAIKQKFLDRFGLNIGIKPMIDADAGKAHIAIDYTPSDALNNNIAKLLESECIAAGIVTVGNIVVPVSVGGQSFDYKWVKAVEKAVKFKVTITVSRSSTNYLESEIEIRDRFLANYASLYDIGYDIEPESYYEINRDAKYASDILTQFSFDDGTTWLTVPHESLYSDKFVPTLNTQDITIVRP